MTTIYINTEFKCYTTNPDGIYREIETNSFDGMCSEFIEGFRFVPAGESWTRDDGTVFFGEMVSAWKPYDELDAAQREFERQKLAQQEATIAELDALVLNLQYNNLIK